MSSLVITHATFRGVPVLRLAGSLAQEQDLGALRSAAATLAETRASAMVLDFSDVTVIDFAGLGVLLELRPIVGLAGPLYLLRTPEALRSKMARAHVDTMFTLVSDEAELSRAMDADGLES